MTGGFGVGTDRILSPLQEVERSIYLSGTFPFTLFSTRVPCVSTVSGENRVSNHLSDTPQSSSERRGGEGMMSFMVFTGPYVEVEWKGQRSPCVGERG